MAGKKPLKPLPKIPLFAHSNVQYAKTIRDSIRDFSKWNGHTTAVGNDFQQHLDRSAGRIPRISNAEDVAEFGMGKKRGNAAEWRP